MVKIHPGLCWFLFSVGLCWAQVQKEYDKDQREYEKDQREYEKYGVKQKPNVCKTFDDYYKMEGNPNCWYNPDGMLDATQLVKRYGYPVENYTITTEDGYILTLHRIPRKKNPRGVVILQHPALTSCTMWIDKGNHSLGFQLFDAGYDVWLSNLRGTRYSRRHVILSENDTKYWDHSFHEMALYDMPAQLKFIDEMTKAAPNIAYVGHSMGGTLSVLYPSIMPEEAAKYFKVFVAAGGGTQLKYSKPPPWEIVMMFSDLVPGLTKLLNINFILDNFLFSIYNGFCAKYDAGIELCANMVYYMMGALSYKDQMVPEWYPTIFSQNPSGISSKSFLHYLQNAKVGRFQQWDYGNPEENMKNYNSTTPPLYRVEDIKVPIFFITGDMDTIAAKEDSQEIYERLKGEAAKYGHYIIPGFNHFDYIYGRKIDVFNKHVIRFLNKIYKKRRL